jgi:hypothetical protein
VLAAAERDVREGAGELVDVLPLAAGEIDASDRGALRLVLGREVAGDVGAGDDAWMIVNREARE